MKKTAKIMILIFLAVTIVTGFYLLLKFYIIPQSKISGCRENFNVLDKSEISENGDRIHFLSTGSSDCILLESGGKFALVDCAEDTDNPRDFKDLEFEGYETKVLDYLKKNAASKDGKVHLDFVLGTHSHSDHIGGFDSIISDKDVVVSRAYLRVYDETKIDTYEVENWDNKEVYLQMVDALNSKNIPIISDFKETKFTLGNFNITLFNTENQNDTGLVGENDNSIGVLIEKSGARVFLAADIDNKSGDESRLKDQIGKIDLLKVGHHSYSHSTSSGWLRTLYPSVCVVTNNYENADKKTLRTIERICGSVILVTGKENGVIASINDDGTISYYNNIH